MNSHEPPPCPVCGSTKERKRSRVGRYGIRGSVFGMAILVFGLLGVAFSWLTFISTTPLDGARQGLWEISTTSLIATIGGLILTGGRTPYRCSDCQYEF
ncbi:MAG: hypothetical protein KDC95_03455 [Planctomycetes bacterium]|nr:hypothetical protein [Planctomycetota bacterium]